MADRSPPRAPGSWESLPRAASLTVVLVGVLVLLGWTFDILALKSVLPGLVSMKANTALGFVLAGLALGATLRRRPSRLAGLLGPPCALLVALIGALTLAESLFGWDLGMDEMLFEEEPGAVGTSAPGRMAPSSALGLFLVGVALVLVGAGRRRSLWVGQLLGLLAGFLALLALIGYAYGVEAFYGAIGRHTRMAFHTAATFELLSVGILLARPREGVAAFLTSDHLGAILARRLLPAAIGLPIALGWLRLLGERAGLYGTEFGVALVVACTVVLFTALVVWNAALLNRAEREHLRAEAALRTSEVRLRSFSESSSDAVVIAEAEGRIVSWNPAAERTFGYAEEEVRGKPIAMLMPERYREAHREGLRRYLATGEARVIGRTVELHGLRKDGSEFPVELSLSSWRTDEGPFFGGILRDISGRKRTEAALADRTAQLEVANRELEAFSYSVSHDLRAPLRAINGFSEALVEDFGSRLDPSGVDHLGRIRGACRNMGELIDGLLALSWATRTELRQETVDLSAMAGEIASRLSQSDPGRDVEFRIEPGLVARGDPLLLRVVLENLLGNAWKFTGRHPRARIGLGTEHGENGRVFCVRDDGAGFDMTYAHKLFGAFQRLHSSHEFEGTGIGLATVHRILRRHGGRIWAEGKVDGGAAFYFALPEG